MYRIFLVEDDETIAKLVRRHLEKWDYDVHVVQKFDAVMSEFASFDPHLVLMDIGLRFTMGITGVRKSEGYQRFLWFSCHPQLII